jgi:hypothetical protein
MDTKQYSMIFIQNFDLFIDDDGNIVIAFDPPIQKDARSYRPGSIETVDDEWDVFNSLCQTVCNMLQALKINLLNLVSLFRHSTPPTVFFIVSLSLSSFKRHYF